MQTLELDFSKPAHFDVLGKIRQVRSTGDAKLIANEQAGTVTRVNGKVGGLEKFDPEIAKITGVRIELGINENGGAFVEYRPRAQRNPDFPPCITKLDEPGDNYPILVGDPTGNRMVVAKAFVCVKNPSFLELIKMSLGSFFNAYGISRI